MRLLGNACADIYPHIYPRMADKALFWLGSSREAVRSFSPESRREAGYQPQQV